MIPLGGTVEARLADPKAYDPGHRPGGFYRYSNLGFPIVATAMEKAAGERFDRLIDRLVLKPMKLDACFNWSTCSDAAAARAVVLYSAAGETLRDDHKGRRPGCLVVPAADGSCDLAAYRIGTHGGLFSPQGGLRISVRDLAAIGQLLLRKGRLAGGGRLLSEASVAEMIRPAWRFDGTNGEQEKGFYCGYGLAVQILAQCLPKDDPIGDARTRYGHAGDAYGGQVRPVDRPGPRHWNSLFRHRNRRRGERHPLGLLGDRGMARGEGAVADVILNSFQDPGRSRAARRHCCIECIRSRAGRPWSFERRHEGTRRRKSAAASFSFSCTFVPSL